MTSVLLERFPQIGPALEARTRWQPNAGGHAVFANVFAPYVVELLQGGGDESQITEAFAFIEELAGNREPGIQEVVTESLLEILLRDSVVLRLDIRGRSFVLRSESAVGRDIRGRSFVLRSEGAVGRSRGP